LLDLFGRSPVRILETLWTETEPQGHYRGGRSPITRDGR
jgi:hypothetical protein